MSIIKIFLAVVCMHASQAIKCSDGYTCYEQTASLVWVIQNEGNVNGPNCQHVCEHALCGSGFYHSCNQEIHAVKDQDSFSLIANGLGFECKRGRCWNSNSWDGQMWVSIKTNQKGKKSCYLPKANQLSCNAHPGNANCYQERYSLVCPCSPKPLEEACVWDSPPHSPAIPTFPSDASDGKSCLDRINYWRKRACDEGWPECPPCGLPPMTECVDCHECANSQAEYDHKHGPHKSFKRCGDHEQGEGGGASCGAVIDGFVHKERKVYPDTNGQKRCRGHCAPILAKGCQTFFWGRARRGNFHTINWKSCKTKKCTKYCEKHQNQCFAHPDSTFVQKSRKRSATFLHIVPIYLLVIIFAQF